MWGVGNLSEILVKSLPGVSDCTWELFCILIIVSDPKQRIWFYSLFYFYLGTFYEKECSSLGMINMGSVSGKMGNV